VAQNPPAGCAAQVTAPRYGRPMPRRVSIHELGDRTDTVLVAVQAGERLTLTSDGKPVADIVPHAARRSPWLPAAELRRIRREAPAILGWLPISGALASADQHRLTSIERAPVVAVWRVSAAQQGGDDLARARCSAATCARRSALVLVASDHRELRVGFAAWAST
jgi:prevent-host-death family protein